MSSVAHKLSLPSQAYRRQGRDMDLNRQIEKLFRRLRMAVVYGGDKSKEGAVIEPTTNPRSWKSYEAVAKDIASAMRRLGCKNIDLMPDDMHLGERLKDIDAHIAWLNTGGVQGHCSVAHAPAMLELFGIPYIGHDPMTAGILDNKHVFKRQVRAAGIPTANFYIWQPGSSPQDPTKDPHFAESFGHSKGPFIVKPVSGRASLHVSFVEKIGDVAEAVRKVYDITRNHVLIESYLGGREFCVAVAGPVIWRHGRAERLDGPFVFSALERVLDKDEKIFTSMDVKPITGERAFVLDPAKEGVLCDRLTKLARDVFTQLGVETLIRLDVRSDADGNLFVLEANPKPDLKAPAPGVTSLVSIGLPQHGMTYDDLIMSVFADRVDVLLSERRGTADRLTRLL
ncbi:MAG: D-alanine--D-alanine ligase family protein [Beijerinckiaceae bacterium]